MGRNRQTRGLESLRINSLRSTIVTVWVLLGILSLALVWLGERLARGGIKIVDGGFFVAGSTVWALAVLLLVYVATFLCVFLLCIRCRRWRSFSRVLLWFAVWVPAVNVVVALYFLRIARQEATAYSRRSLVDLSRRGKNVCMTRYPLLLVHGLAFRDFRRFNYWGRIPEELVRNGALVFHGGQEAWGTIEHNAAILKRRVIEVIEQTGCEKVNIIAHSKGGIDARYMISALGMADRVASLTTVSTPHRGSALVERLRAVLPDRLYRKISVRVDDAFKKLGDENPDSYEASLQLSREYMKDFNERCLDSDKVGYFSVGTVLKNVFSSLSMWFTYLVLKKQEGDNDGLVAERSAKWGEYLGTAKASGRRGVSHVDIIDVRRDDFRGFDVLEFYIELVGGLRKRGF